MAVALLLNNVFSRPANAAITQFRAVYQYAGTAGSDYCDTLTNNGTMPIGVLINKVAAQGRAARIAGPGCITKMEANAAIAEGDRVMVAAGGFGAVATLGTNVWAIGVAMEPASGSGAYFSVLVHPGRGVQ